MYRVHGDRAQEVTGRQVQDKMTDIGIVVTSTAGYDHNANGRAERVARWIKEKTRTLLVNEIRDENFRTNINS